MSEQITSSRSPLLQEMLTKCSHLGIPAYAVLELTYRCNLRCIHCYVDVNESDELTLEEWEGVIDQLKAAGTIYLLFTGGEIMERADFLDIARYARGQGFLVGLLTNCTMLTPGFVKDIVDLKPFCVTTSLYGASAATHEIVTGVPSSYDKTIDGIRLLVDHGLIPLVQTLIMKSNVTELQEIRNLVERMGAQVSIDIGIAPSKTGATFPFQYEPDMEDLVECGWQPDTPSNFLTDGYGLCKAGKSLCSVSPKGDVFPCLMFPLRLGNLRESEFEKIWRLGPCAELRYLRSMRRTDLYTCNQCHLEAYCHRCTGIAYLESGCLDGPSSSACRQAQMRWRLNQAAEVILCPKSPI